MLDVAVMFKTVCLLFIKCPVVLKIRLALTPDVSCHKENSEGASLICGCFFSALVNGNGAVFDFGCHLRKTAGVESCQIVVTRVSTCARCRPRKTVPPS